MFCSMDALPSSHNASLPCSALWWPCEIRITAQVGRLWAALADYYIRQGLYEKARDVYEEGLTTVVTVRDFSLIFDTLTQFEESLLQHQLQNAADEPEEAPTTDSDGEDFALRDSGNDIDLRRVASGSSTCFLDDHFAGLLLLDECDECSSPAALVSLWALSMALRSARPKFSWL